MTDVLLRKARSQWLSLPISENGPNDHMNSIEESLREAWKSSDPEKPDEKLPAVESMAIRKVAGEKLALLLLQSRRAKEADEILHDLGYPCRLSSKILDYPLPERNKVSVTSPERDRLVPCQVFDEYLSRHQLESLMSVFGDSDASYWKTHSYCAEPPSPYYSYIIPLDDSTKSNYGLIGTVIDSLYHFVKTKWGLRQPATACEMWAHHRPHCSGHQLHFDTDNEGCGGVVKHPLVTCIIYLTSGCGGPSMITNQRVTSRSLADKAWLCHAEANRLVIMDGKVLHCVLPGKALPPKSTSRVTLMLAFWKDIRVRGDGGTKGAARRFPNERPNIPEWASMLLCGNKGDQSSIKLNDQIPFQTMPTVIEVPYESVRDGAAWRRSMGLPKYDDVFHG